MVKTNFTVSPALPKSCGSFKNSNDFALEGKANISAVIVDKLTHCNHSFVP